ncbi:hypothetical protein [Neisseria animaloris]|uniref:hypothetical protein n=1 Tax=Neisseria animaloris TaxID=326522 RepID=UPI000F815F1A|nr:hypothetical protein [Neisseria animaloris]
MLLHPPQTALVGWAYECIRVDETQPKGGNPSAEIIVDTQSEHFEENAAESAEESGLSAKRADNG